jgi:bacterioferritin
MADKKTFIEKLNKALEWEYASSIQYVQHASLITWPEYDSIAEELKVHAEEELAHAIKVADIIWDLWGTPSVDVEKRETSENSKEMLEQDLKWEEIAIKLYKELIAMAEELWEYGKRRILEDILMDEEEHKRDLLWSLGK